MVRRAEREICVVSEGLIWHALELQLGLEVLVSRTFGCLSLAVLSNAPCRRTVQSVKSCHECANVFGKPQPSYSQVELFRTFNFTGTRSDSIEYQKLVSDTLSTIFESFAAAVDKDLGWWAWHVGRTIHLLTNHNCRSPTAEVREMTWRVDVRSIPTVAQKLRFQQRNPRPFLN